MKKSIKTKLKNQNAYFPILVYKMKDSNKSMNVKHNMEKQRF